MESGQMGNGEGQKKRGHGCFFYGCITVVVLVAVCVGALVAVFLYGKGQVAPCCEAYLSAVEQGDYETAYQQIGERWKQQQSFEQYVDFEKALRETLGTCRDKSVGHVSISSRPGAAYARIVYNAEFENGLGTIVFSLEKEQGQWVVQGVNYNSPVLIPLLECPHCGVTQKSITKFCADCGKPMRPSTEADDPTEQTEAE